jgi:peptidoglycan/LPS O-acetylase OafA/YrhL
MASFFSRTLSPPAVEPGPVGRDLPLEGMRGLCAFLVMYNHAFAPIPVLDPVYSPPDAFSWLEVARVAVLFFFVLSGYVIGLTVRTDFSGGAARGYLGRRLLRLVPINVAAVLISWALAPRTSVGTVAGNLAFLQNYNPYFFGWRVPIMANNASLWTLNFELLYYILFLAVWRLAPRLGSLAIGLTAVAVSAAILPGIREFLSCYAVGALYWFAGLTVAWLGLRGTRRGNWPSALLIAAVMWPLDPIGKLFSAFHFNDYSVPPVSLQRLDLLAVCLWLLLAITGRSPRWLGRLTLACLVWASIAWVARVATHDFGDKSAAAYIAYAAAILAAWVLARWKPDPAGLSALAPLGLVSFGLYSVSLAIQFGILSWRSLPSGSAATFSLRLAILLGLSLSIAWLLERRLQPALRRRIRGGPRAA